jgi:hypothetical protein
MRFWIRHMMNNAAAEKDFTEWLDKAIQNCLSRIQIGLSRIQKVLMSGDKDKATGLAFEALAYQNLQQIFKTTKAVEQQQLEKMEEKS